MTFNAQSLVRPGRLNLIATYMIEKKKTYRLRDFRARGLEARGKNTGSRLHRSTLSLLNL